MSCTVCGNAVQAKPDCAGAIFDGRCKLLYTGLYKSPAGHLGAIYAKTFSGVNPQNCSNCSTGMLLA
jgi:hypothetical protein